MSQPTGNKPGHNAEKGKSGFQSTGVKKPAAPTAAPKTNIKKIEVPEGYALYGSADIPLPIPDPFVNPGPNSGLEQEEIWKLWRQGEDKVGNSSSLLNLKYGSKEFLNMREAFSKRYDQWHKDNTQPPMHSPERTARMRDHYEHKEERFAEIVGALVEGIWFDDNLLTFETDKGLYSYYLTEYGGESYFADFHGVNNLYENGPVLSIQEIPLQSGDPGYLPPDSKGPRGEDSVAVYGVRLTTMHPTFGKVSSTFSFRNESNGYYGSEIFRQRDGGQGKESEKRWLDYISPKQVKLTEDKVGD